MRALRTPLLVALLSGLAAGCLHLPGYDGTDGSADADSDSDADSDTDTDADSDTDADAGACEASGVWYDPATDLCWQDPPLTGAFLWDDAVIYCDDLSLGGADDWRLPKIQELISLIRGCVSGEATGDLSPSTCGVTDPGCLLDECLDVTDCGDCPNLGGPGTDPEGCYWPPQVEGTCNWYWSSSTCESTITWAWSVYFPYGSVAYGEKTTYSNYVRCVR